MNKTNKQIKSDKSTRLEKAASLLAESNKNRNAAIDELLIYLGYQKDSGLSLDEVDENYTCWEFSEKPREILEKTIALGEKLDLEKEIEELNEKLEKIKAK
jgi:DNA-binding transcriptional MerR regulator